MNPIYGCYIVDHPTMPWCAEVRAPNGQLVFAVGTHLEDRHRKAPHVEGGPDAVGMHGTSPMAMLTRFLRESGVIPADGTVWPAARFEQMVAERSAPPKVMLPMYRVWLRLPEGMAGEAKHWAYVDGIGDAVKAVSHFVERNEIDPAQFTGGCVQVDTGSQHNRWVDAAHVCEFDSHGDGKWNVELSDRFAAAEERPPLYAYSIDLDERGAFRASVRDDGGHVVYTVIAGTELADDCTSVFEDGYMRDKNDVAGLEKYLRSVGAIPTPANLVPLAECEERQAARRLNDEVVASAQAYWDSVPETAPSTTKRMGL